MTMTPTDLFRFSVGLHIALLLLFVFYLCFPRALRKQYFGAQPKRHAWAARPPTTRVLSVEIPERIEVKDLPDSSSASRSSEVAFEAPREETVRNRYSVDSSRNQQVADDAVGDGLENRLADQGIVLVAHGTEGKHRTVLLKRRADVLTWRRHAVADAEVHAIPLAELVSIDVGKQTAALRHSDKAQIHEDLCFSLVTRRGSLDLQAPNRHLRDRLVLGFDQIARRYGRNYATASTDMYDTDGMESVLL